MKPTVVKCTDIYYVFICIRSIQTPLAPDKPSGSVLDERLCIRQTPAAQGLETALFHRAVLDTFSFPRLLGTV